MRLGYDGSVNGMFIFVKVHVLKKHIDCISMFFQNTYFCLVSTIVESVLLLMHVVLLVVVLLLSYIYVRFCFDTNNNK